MRLVEGMKGTAATSSKSMAATGSSTRDFSGLQKKLNRSSRSKSPGQALVHGNYNISGSFNDEIPEKGSAAKNHYSDQSGQEPGWYKALKNKTGGR